jgi:hypothetical protein
VDASSQDLRALAANCQARAEDAGPQRAAQLRDCVRAYRRQALESDLFEHGKQVGRANVTLASFREHLRARQLTAQ